MDEQNQPSPPQRYIWPRFVLAGVTLGIALAVLWMSVLVRRVREQRDEMWPTVPTTPTQSVTIPTPPSNSAPKQPAPTNSAPQAGVDPIRAERMTEFRICFQAGPRRAED